MKKLLALIAAFAAIVSLFILSSAAEGVTVYVSVAVSGQIAIAALPVTVTDTDGDGVLSISDALACAHNNSGKEYVAADTDYGKTIYTLWGITNGGWYGCYHNNESVYSLASEVSDGDRIYAFTYKDTEYASDLFTYFELADDGLVLYSVGYDAEWNIVSSPLADAVITLDGADTEYTTDSLGKAPMPTSNTVGRHIISVRKDGAILVPAVCTFETNYQGIPPILAFCIVIAIALVIAGTIVIIIKKVGKSKNA